MSPSKVQKGFWYILTECESFSAPFWVLECSNGEKENTKSRGITGALLSADR